MKAVKVVNTPLDSYRARRRLVTGGILFTRMALPQAAVRCRRFYLFYQNA